MNGADLGPWGRRPLFSHYDHYDAFIYGTIGKSAFEQLSGNFLAGRVPFSGSSFPQPFGHRNCTVRWVGLGCLAIMMLSAMERAGRALSNNCPEIS